MASSFEHYCRERWQFERRHAYRLIDSARVIENVSHGTQAPESEYVYNCRQTVYRIPSPPPRERWQFARNYANKLIASSQVIENLNKGTIVPKTESQARPLTKLEPEQQKEARHSILCLLSRWQGRIKKSETGKSGNSHRLLTTRLNEVSEWLSIM